MAGGGPGGKKRGELVKGRGRLGEPESCKNFLGELFQAKEKGRLEGSKILLIGVVTGHLSRSIT